MGLAGVGHPLGEMLLGSLRLTHDERGVIQQAIEEIIRERAGGRGTATLTSPTNIGVGTT